MDLPPPIAPNSLSPQRANPLQLAHSRAIKRVVSAVLLLFGTSCSRSSVCHIDEALVERVSAARGIVFNRPVSCRVERRAEVIKSLQAEMVRSVSPERYRYEGEVFRLLGIIPPRFDYPEQVAVMYARGMRGRYVTDERSIVLTGMSVGRGQDGVLAHELVHALQDQYVPLKAVLAPELTNDQALARAALLEGDAIVSSRLTESEKFCSSVNRETIMRQLGMRSGRAAIGIDPKLSTLQLILDFPYIFGPAYRCVRRNDGSGADVLDLLPDSSAEIMQKVGLYPLSHGNTGSDPLGGSAAADELFSDTLGQFGLLALLMADLPLVRALDAAEAWQADRVALLPRGLIWQIQCVSEAKAQILASALKGLPQKHLKRLAWPATSSVKQHGQNVVFEIR